MASLDRDARRALERACTRARIAAESAAAKALHSLAVGEREAFPGMTAEQKSLRSRLRAHGRQLGDIRSAEKGTQSVEHLVAECAYEQWHRMLFARFLSENQLLIEPESGVALALDEVKELAHARNKHWVTLAGEFAVKMLPQVFRQDDPVLAVEFAPEDRTVLEALLEGLPRDVFIASDALGWCYQFWQSEKKDEVNASGAKIGADELPAVTQLFTEDYMVDFLLDNTLGAWHAGKIFAGNPRLAESARSEDELRQILALPGCLWKYLRFVKGEDGKWAPAAGTFDGWPKNAAALRALDPCMGSGHFVVAMFERLVALRLAEETLDQVAAVAAVIRDNLFGLEIDPRCTQIGAFNLALAAWRRVGHCQLPTLNLACSGIAPNTRVTDWLAIAGDNEKLRNGMERLYRLFQQAPVLGSLINPRAGEGDLLVAAFHELRPLLDKALAQEAKDDTAHEVAVTARGLAKAAEIAAGHFTLVATNVPYLGQRKQNSVLSEYAKMHHPLAKADLATCFIERCLSFCDAGGSVSIIAPQDWLSLGSFERLRRQLFAQYAWKLVARLGAKAFQTPMWDFNVAALVCSDSRPDDEATLAGLDVGPTHGVERKARALASSEIITVAQLLQLGNPDAKLSFEPIRKSALLSDYAASRGGITTGDSPRFRLTFWELDRIGQRWVAQQGTFSTTREYAGCQLLLDWSNGTSAFAADPAESGATIAGRDCWGRRGVVVRYMGHLPASQYVGTVFENVVAVIVPHDPSHLAAIWCFCSSTEFHRAVRSIDQKLAVTCNTLAKVPFELSRWQKIASDSYPLGLPKPFSSDATQWLFDGDPASADQPLHVAAARLLGYRWPRQTGTSFPDCPALGPDTLEALADDDGIVPISPAKGEGQAAERLRELLAQAYGREWNAIRQEALLTKVGFAGALLEDWLRNGFFEQHCALFHHRPFIWHLWDGLPDGFGALVNYHSLAASEGAGRRALEKLTYTYLGDWITAQKAGQKDGKEGADGKLAAALHLQKQMTAILEGEPPFDLFVRWKPLHAQAIGWEPDINDGVRANIRPFMMAKTLNNKSIFRKAPKIKWEKDRGTEPERPKRDFPWFWSWDEESEDFQGAAVFDGKRWNDLHYSNDVKAAARQSSKAKGR